jgi:hypothetical protein
VLVRTLPAASLARHRTVVVPTSKRVPAAGEQVTRTAPSRVSMVDGSAYLTLVPCLPGETACTVLTSAMRGGSTSAGRAGSRLGSTMPQ